VGFLFPKERKKKKLGGIVEKSYFHNNKKERSIRFEREIEESINLATGALSRRGKRKLK